MTFTEFKAFASRPRPGQRKGQAAFNALWEERPDLSERVRSTPLDPFYDDLLLPAFWAWVEKHWSDAP